MKAGYAGTKKLAVIYHSAHGHTEHIAKHVAEGARGVSGTFKTFMDSTGRLWRDQGLRGRLAAGFTVSSLPSGDKQSTLLSLFVFAMQHGMVWVGNPVIPEQHLGVPYDEAANRLGSWSGLMAQAGHASPADSFVRGDIRGASLFGRHFAESLQRFAAVRHAQPETAAVKDQAATGRDCERTSSTLRAAAVPMFT